MEIKVPTLKEILNFMCKPKVRIYIVLCACTIFMINIILMLFIKNYHGAIGNLIGWSILIVSWINNILYSHGKYGHEKEKSWQDRLKERYNLND